VPPAQLEANAQHFVVQLSGPPGGQTRRDIERAGASIVAPLPPQAYLVDADAKGVAKLQALREVGWISTWEPRHKVAPEIAQVQAEDADPIIVVLQLFPGRDPAAMSRELRSEGLAVRGVGHTTHFGRLVLVLDAPTLVAHRERLAAREDVFWIGRRYRRGLLNDTSVWVGQSGVDGQMATPIFDQGLNGEGQIAGVFDTGIDIDSCYFRDDDVGLPAINVGFGTDVELAHRKVIAVNFHAPGDDPQNPGHWESWVGHGTHCAGSVAGDRDAAGVHDARDGMAPAAKLVIQDGGFAVDDCADLPALGCPAAALTPFFDQAYEQGARIHSNSWGDAENAPQKNLYTDGSEDADAFVHAHPDFLLVFAAGNAGSDADTVGSPATGKNVLAVGATRRADEAGQLAGFSSRGPTHDGRIKPDVTAPGVNIASAESDNDIGTDNCGAHGLSGTSMACPTAAGLGLLARQYFTDGFWPTGAAVPADGFDPTAALLKATLIHAAEPMSAHAPPPSFNQGWGRIRLDTVLTFAGDARVLYIDDDGASFSDPDEPDAEYLVEVDSDTEPLRVTLVWTDYPSTAAAETNLVNDLDLTVSGPAGTFLGNVITDGASVEDGDPDRLNNVERVELPTPDAGVYTVSIDPYAIPMGPQDYALVITGDLGEVDDGDDETTGDTGETTGDDETGTGTGGGTDSADDSVDSDGNDDEDDGSSGDDGTSTDDDAAGDDGSGSSGCGCMASNRPPAFAWLALFGLATFRRRMPRPYGSRARR
jgi:hypothetical protein